MGELTVTRLGPHRIVEGPEGSPLLLGAPDSHALVEACLTARTDLALLYTANLPAAFFQLKSGDAGEILQKLRNYRIRLALVVEPGMELGERFTQLMREERRGPWFGLFESREEAVSWLQEKPEV